MSWLRMSARLFSQAALAFLFVAAAARMLVSATPAPDFSRFEHRSQLVESIRGEPLWGFLAADGRWRFSAGVDDVDPKYLKMLIAYEDQRFWSHPGVDALALARAAREALWRGRAVSGGSTLTMQTVRLLEPQPRTFLAKIDQMLKALKLEHMMGKVQILRIYLTLAPFGGNVDGVRSASLLYLGKQPKHLSMGEAAMLVAIPQAPEDRRPDRYPTTALAARDRVVNTLSARCLLSRDEVKLAHIEIPVTRQRSFSFAAPHFAIRVRDSADPSAEMLPTLIDRVLQQDVEALVSRALKRWDDAVNIAVVVVRNADSSFAAYVGGADFGAPARGGYLDLARAERSPGSALKPFIYAAAFDKLIVHPDTIITDHPVQIDGYRPDNADGQFMGDLTVRQALVRSRNTTAVMLLEKVGVGDLLERFRGVGSPLSLPISDPSGGLATALGGEGVRLEQLAWFYTAFARDGKLGALRSKPADPVENVGSLMSAYAARATADILADSPPPSGFERLAAADGSRRLGFKTGTSFGFRDAWAVGFDKLHTVAVWVGRPDGAAHLGAYGITVAAPLLMQVFEALPQPDTGIRYSETELGPLGSGRPLPPRLARFEGARASESASDLSIFFPRNGATIDSGRSTAAPVELTLTAQGGKPPYTWQIDGQPTTSTQTPSTKWSFDARGQFDVRIQDANGGTAHSSFWLN
jgi:penicillin-binding protein 1C